MNLKNIGILLLLVFAFTACNETEEVKVSSLSNDGAYIPPILVEEPAEEPVLVDEDDGAVEVISEDENEEESSDEVLSDDETNQEPEDVVDSTDGAYIPPSDDGEGDDSSDDGDDDGAVDPSELCQVKGNLIQNGSFELSDNRIGQRGKMLSSIVSKNWDVYQSLPSDTLNKDSWYTSSGAGIEVQGDNTVTKAPHGNRVVELDSHGAENTNSTMAQDVLLCKGKHILKFMYYPRTNTAGDNIIEVSVNGEVIKSVDMVKIGKWVRIRAPFKVNEQKTYKISFAAKGMNNSLGGLVDQIKLHKKIKRAGVVTSLISLGDQDNITSPLIRREVASAIIRKSVNFASIKKDPKILFVKDTRHNNESLDDFVLTESVLRELFGDANVSVWSEDLRAQNAVGFDVIYVVNPGHPLGSSITADTLKNLRDTGKVGIVLHGDDMSRGRNFALNDLTGLKYKSNGTSACGINIDNNRGNKYSVKLRKRFFKKLSVEARIMDYANDIDHTEVVNPKVRILAMAKAPNGCDLKIPAIVGYKLDRPVVSGSN
jgi:hypothetical protein